jgi:hypothetical protein
MEKYMKGSSLMTNEKVMEFSHGKTIGNILEHGETENNMV